MTAVLRHTVPVNDQWHPVTYAGHIVHVATRKVDAVELWTVALPDQAETVHHLRVFGTGQPIEAPVFAHRGTALAAGGSLVWHLIEEARA